MMSPLVTPFQGGILRNRSIIAAVTAALAVTLVGCSSSDSNTGDSSKAAAPRYTVIKDTNRAVELLVEDATKDSATAALEDWIDTKVGDRKSVSVQVVRNKDAGTIVCRAEYYADEETANVQTGGRIKAAEWPHTEVECPDPAGS